MLTGMKKCETAKGIPTSEKRGEKSVCFPFPKDYHCVLEPHFSYMMDLLGEEKPL